MAIWQPISTWSHSVQEEAVKLPRWHWLMLIWERESQRLAIWSPLLLVTGIWIYFNLGEEPPVLLAATMTVFATAILMRYRHKKLLVILAIISLGFAVATWRTISVATPLLRAYAPGIAIKGQVVDVEQRGKSRQRIILALQSAANLPADEIPLRVQLQILTKAPLPKIGDTLSVTADLSPLPGPILPGSFDYGRQLYFQSIGAMARTKFTPLISAEPASWSYALRRNFHALRTAIGTRIRAVIPGPLGAIADALITGERTAIPRSIVNSLQASGLFHILSISGLHMSMVAGGTFWVVRAGLALFPLLALRFPIKKWAAMVAVLVGFFYMLLADSGAATERSFIMIAVVFFAVLVDRPALSLHNLAVAAVLILLWAPEQAVAASFQMSFMAVMGLAAFFAWWQKFVPQPIAVTGQNMFSRWLRKIVILIIASLATSLVAGALSSIPAAHHFGRLAPYSLFANAMALPIVGLVVMPMAMLSVLLMPLGLDAVPLHVMEIGLQLVVSISDWVASWPGANGQMPRISAFAAVLLALAAAAICLPATRLRVLALPLSMAAVLVLMQQAKPDVLIDERAGNVAIYTPDGLVPADGEKAGFSAGRWLKEYGDNLSPKKAAMRAGWSCKEGVCLANVKGRSIAFLKGNVALTKICPKVDILVAQYPLRRRCKGVEMTIDRFDVWRSGAHAIWLNDHTLRLAKSKQQQGNRPWVYQPRPRNKQLSRKYSAAP